MPRFTMGNATRATVLSFPVDLLTYMHEGKRCSMEVGAVLCSIPGRRVCDSFQASKRGSALSPISHRYETFFHVRLEKVEIPGLAHVPESHMETWNLQIQPRNLQIQSHMVT